MKIIYKILIGVLSVFGISYSLEFGMYLEKTTSFGLATGTAISLILLIMFLNFYIIVEPWNDKK